MIYITALLFIKEGKEQHFYEYENAVLPILKNYNGILMHRLRPSEENYISTSTEEKPYEIHLISFPSDDNFMSYINDPERISYNHLKEDSLECSYIYKGEKL